MTLPITVAVCTYNEERHIRQCLDAILANEPAQVIVVDGCSTDDTWKIVYSYGYDCVMPVALFGKGLASQRQEALDLTSQPYHAVVDAHHRLDMYCLRDLLDEMVMGGRWRSINQPCAYAAIQACEWQVPSSSYWTNARASGNWDITHHSRTVPTNMVGRPALYITKVLRAVGGFDPAFDGVGDEDTDLSIRMQMHGYLQAQGTGIARRVDELDFRSVMRKFVKYGRGDARIVRKYPFKRWAIVKHLLWTYPWRRGLRRPWFWPYFALCGWVRFGAMVWGMICDHSTV
jgi:glycosyltransferase involved in cell wall biosynthesis